MPKLLQLKGQKFGRLTVIELSPKRSTGGCARWVCQCECGQTTTVSSSNLQQGIARSCGCLMREVLKARKGTTRAPYRPRYRPCLVCDHSFCGGGLKDERSKSPTYRKTFDLCSDNCRAIWYDMTDQAESED